MTAYQRRKKKSPQRRSPDGRFTRNTPQHMDAQDNSLFLGAAAVLALLVVIVIAIIIGLTRIAG